MARQSGKDKKRLGLHHSSHRFKRGEKIVLLNNIQFIIQRSDPAPLPKPLLKHRE